MPTPAQTAVTADDKIVFLLSYLSNLVSFVTGPHLDIALYSAVASGLVKTGTPWRIVWGPAVRQFPENGYALNAMYVASPIAEPSRYVIAIAGTNIPSLLDWFLEDLNVGIQVPWTAPEAAGRPAVSLATASGLSILLTMTPSPGLPGAGMALPRFLGQLTRGALPPLVETTGHSLGGALSPTLALWLADHQGEASGWDPRRVAAVSSMPTAGPTPGNRDFATYYDSRLEAATRRFVNDLDPVPRCWELQTLTQLPTLYAPSIPASRGIEFLVAAATAVSEGGGYAPLVPGAAPIEGTVNASIIHPAATPESNYLAQMGYQHTTAYYLAFDLPAAAIPVAPLALPPPPRAAFQPAPHLTGRRMVGVGTAVVELPTGTGDPRAPEIVARLVQVIGDAAVLQPGTGAGQPAAGDEF